MEQVEKVFNYKIYVIAFLIVLFFFVAGISVGKYVAYKQIGDIEISQRAVSALLDLSLIKDKFLDNNTDYCNLTWGDVWSEKVGIGNVIARLEARLGKDNRKVINQKKIYNEVQLKTLRVVENINTQCRMNWSVILFFYSNDKNNKEKYSLGEKQGFILDNIYERNKENAKIFSFDFYLNDSAVQYLSEKYNVTSLPSLVINGKIEERFLSRYEIEKIIEK